MATVVERESNNHASSANPLSLGDTVQGALSSSSDWDFYKVTVSTGGALKLDFSPPTAPNNYYFQIDVFDSGDKLLAENFYGNTGTLSLGLPAAGNYYVAVTSSSSFSSGQYALTVSNGVGSASAYESEANDTLATANSIALAHTIKGQLAGSSDVDCYRVSASMPGVLVVDLVAGKTSSGNSFTVDLYDVAGNLLKEQSTDHATTLSIPVSASGDYVIKVKQANVYDGSNYSLTVNNDSFSTLAAKALTESTPLTATLSAAHDWYSVSLVAGKSYEFSVTGATSSGGTLADPALTLCYSTGAVLETCDDLNIWSSSLTPPGVTTTADPQIAFTAPATGTYYLMVSGNGGAGTYSLSEKIDTQEDLTQALLEVQLSPSYRWNGAAALGTAVSLEYTFLSSTADEETGFVAMTDNQKQMVRDVLAMYESIANITFTEVLSQSSADIRFGTSNQAGLSSGITYTSFNTDGSLRLTDVFLNNTANGSSQSATATLSPGGYGYLTLIHEIGHALGLKHPGNYDAGGDSVSPPFLPVAFDNAKFTVMSYLDNVDSTTYQSTPALIDIAALQYLYGTNTTDTGSAHTFTFNNSSAFVSSLLARGSNDIIDIRDQTVASKIFMLPGSLSSIGIGSDGAPARNNVAIPFNEKLFGVIDGPAADLIVGNTLNNMFYGFAGANTIDGGGGSDTLALSATSTSFNTAVDGQLGNLEFISASTATAAVTIDAHQQTEALTIQGSAYGDSIVASAGGGTINGGAGNDTLTGGAGDDIAAYSGKRSNYSTTFVSAGHYTVLDKLGGSGKDTLTNIDDIRYSDGMENLNVATDAKLLSTSQLNSLTELYIAFFNRVPEASGLDYWIKQLAGGENLTQIVKSFYEAGVQYSSQTGFSSSMTDQDFINIFYKNVLGRSQGADTDGLAYWNGKLAEGSSTRWSLAQDILNSAHTFKNDATWGWVADLLDNKVSVGKYNAVTAAVDYLTSQEAVSKGMEIAQLITPTDTSAAIQLIGLSDVVPYVA